MRSHCGCRHARQIRDDGGAGDLLTCREAHRTLRKRWGEGQSLLYRPFSPLVTRVVYECFLVAVGTWSTTKTSVGSGLCHRPRRTLGWSLREVATTMWLRSAAQPYRGRALQLRFVARSCSVDTHSHLYHWAPNEGARRVPLPNTCCVVTIVGNNQLPQQYLHSVIKCDFLLFVTYFAPGRQKEASKMARKLVPWVGRIIDTTLSIWMGDINDDFGLVRHETGHVRL